MLRIGILLLLTMMIVSCASAPPRYRNTPLEQRQKLKLEKKKEKKSFWDKLFGYEENDKKEKKKSPLRYSSKRTAVKPKTIDPATVKPETKVGVEPQIQQSKPSKKKKGLFWRFWDYLFYSPEPDAPEQLNVVQPVDSSSVVQPADSTGASP